MNRKSLIETNPYLKDSRRREELIIRSVKTSGGVEGIKLNDSTQYTTVEIPRKREKKIFNRIKQTVATK